MRSIAPTLIVADVAASAAYYRERLGFEFTYPDQAAAHNLNKLYKALA